MRTELQTNREFTAVAPATGATIAVHRESSPEELDAAACTAALAATSPAFRDDATRSGLLELTARRLREASREIVTTAQVETGLATPRLEGELERTASQLEAFARLIRDGHYVDAYIDHADPDAKPIPRPDVRRMLVPIGPVAVFGASNFPLAFSAAGGDTASALAAGCPVIVKGHPAHPATGRLVADILVRSVEETGLPDGVFALLTSADATLGRALVERPEIAAVAFTGSFAAGSDLVRRAAARPVPIPVFAEMSSINPLIITPGALAARGETLARGVADAIVGSAGQLCTKPGLIFVPAGPMAGLLERRVSELAAERGAQTLLTRGIRDALVNREAMLDRLATPSGADSPAISDPAGGFRATARIYVTELDALHAHPELREECFGPVALIVEYGSVEELIRALPELGGQLTCTLHSEPDELDLARELTPALQAISGRLVFNGYPTGVSVTSAMQHGGPYPSTSNAGYTSVGMTAIERFLRPVAWQNAPAELLPVELSDANPRGILRTVDGQPGR